MGGDIENKTNIALNWRPAANADGVDAHQPEAAEVEEDELDVAGAVRRQDQLVKDAHQVSVQFFSPLHVQRSWGGCNINEDRGTCIEVECFLFF